MLLIALFAAVLGAAWWLLQWRGQVQAHGAGEAMAMTRPAPAPSQPRAMLQAREPVFVALVLRSGNGCSCETARHFADKTFDIAGAPSLPLTGCASIDCRCRYERIVNRRRGERRLSNDRRDLVRFDMRGDRRTTADRRRPNIAWQQAQR